MGRACEWALVIACGGPEKAAWAVFWLSKMKYNEVLLGLPSCWRDFDHHNALLITLHSISPIQQITALYVHH
jgi:hypothetical protein